MTPLTLSSPTKATAFRIILWRCLAGSEHGITQPRPHDLRWVVRRAAGPKPSPLQANTVVIRRVGYGALGRLDRVRGVRSLRLTCRAADGPAQPEMTLSGRTGSSIWLTAIRANHNLFSFVCVMLRGAPTEGPGGGVVPLRWVGQGLRPVGGSAARLRDRQAVRLSTYRFEALDNFRVSFAEELYRAG